MMNFVIEEIYNVDICNAFKTRKYKIFKNFLVTYKNILQFYCRDTSFNNIVRKTILDS